MARLAKPTRVIVFAEKNGNEPFTQWLYDLKDSVGRKRILIRITRLEQGNYGDCEPVGEGVSELRMFFGPGYRVYFGDGGEYCCLALLRRQRKPATRHQKGQSLLAGVFDQ